MIKLKTYNRAVDNFIKHVANDCEEREIKLLVSLVEFVNADSIKSNGYYDDANKVLAISINKPMEEWLRIFVHEYAHSLQDKEKCKPWVVGSPACTSFFRWYDGQISLTKKELTKCCRQTQLLELDCERRALQLIKKFKLPLDPKEYARKASAYVYFYPFVKKMKKWYKIGHEPYRNKKILALMPDNLDGRYTNVNKRLMELYMECV
jgi:hypothetical protein